ncbi:MAG: hypothetical protein AAFW83_12860 [Pseudomonadota bacterium]
MNIDVDFFNEYSRKLFATREFKPREMLIHKEREALHVKYADQHDKRTNEIKKIIQDLLPSVAFNLTDENLTEEARKITFFSVYPPLPKGKKHKFGKRKEDVEKLKNAITTIEKIEISRIVLSELIQAMLIELPLGGLEELDPNCHNQSYRDYPYGVFLGSQTDALTTIKFLAPYLVEAIERVNNTVIFPTSANVRNPQERNTMNAICRFWKEHNEENMPRMIKVDSGSKLVKFCIEIFETLEFSKSSVETAYAAVNS